MYKKITEKILNKDILKYKLNIKRMIHLGYYENAMILIKHYSLMMNRFNTIYCDNEIEDYISQISQKFSSEFIMQEAGASGVVFYDFLGIERRGLTMIYVKALLNLGYRVCLITYGTSKYSMPYLEKLLSENNSFVYQIKERHYKDQVTEIQKEIINFRPSHIFIHTIPTDVVGAVAFSSLKNNFKVFMINLTDHAFWIGKNSFDFLLEYRSYGYHVSENFRDINKSQLILLPFYPGNVENTEFEGLPFDYRDKKIIFSGGALYKLDGSDVFFDIVKHILEVDESTVFVYAGDGDRKHIEEQLRKDVKYKNRVFLLNERRDFVEIIKRCYFYLSTYPIGGGLMYQYSVAEKKIPIGYGKDIGLTSANSFFLKDPLITLVYDDLEEMYKEIDRLLKDEDYLKVQESRLEGLLLTPIDFQENLANIMNGETASKFLLEDVYLNTANVKKTFFDGITSNRYYRIFSGEPSLIMFLLFPIKFTRGASIAIFKKVAKTLNNLIS